MQVFANCCKLVIDSHILFLPRAGILHVVLQSAHPVCNLIAIPNCQSSRSIHTWLRYHSKQDALLQTSTIGWQALVQRDRVSLAKGCIVEAAYNCSGISGKQYTSLHIICHIKMKSVCTHSSFTLPLHSSSWRCTEESSNPFGPGKMYEMKKARVQVQCCERRNRSWKLKLNFQRKTKKEQLICQVMSGRWSVDSVEVISLAVSFRGGEWCTGGGGEGGPRGTCEIW